MPIGRQAIVKRSSARRQIAIEVGSWRRNGAAGDETMPGDGVEEGSRDRRHIVGTSRECSV